MATQITATLPTLDFPQEVDYPTQEDWAAFSAAAELNFGILGGDWSTKMQNWKDQANDMSIELNNNADIAQSIANYQGDWVSQGYTLGQSVSVSGVYYICKLTHITGQNPTTGGSLYWNIALGNWNLKVNNYGNETIAGIKTFSLSPIVPTPVTTGNVITMDNIIQKTAVGLGYGTGSGGAVTQLTSKSTSVTLNKPTGIITMNNDALVAGSTVIFILNNTLLSGNDIVLLNSNFDNANPFYNVWSSLTVSGMSYINVKNISSGSLSEAIRINFAILKGANS